jgi:hypothetical protein
MDITSTLEVSTSLENLYVNWRYPNVPLTQNARFDAYWCEKLEDSVPAPDKDPIILEWQQPISPLITKLMGDLLPFITFRLVRDAKSILIGTVLDFTRVYGWTWCFSRQRGFLSMAIDSKWQTPTVSSMYFPAPRSPLPPVEPERKMNLRVFMGIVGPNSEDIHCYGGEGRVLDTIVTSDCDYIVCVCSTGVRVPIPLEVRAVYQRKWLEADYSQPKLKDGDYYTRSIGSYSAWSYPVHVDQVRDILKNVPSDWVVIAPADGLGVVARAWPGKLVSGDQVKSTYSHQETRSELIEGTIDRGIRESGNKLVIFSYCWEWVPQDVKLTLLKQKIPFVVLQPTDNLQMQEIGLVFRHYGPGLFGVFLPDDWQFYLHQVERFRPNSSVLYSENLLVQRGFQVYSHSDYFKYFSSMKPRAPIWCHFNGLDVPMNRSTDVTLPHLAANLQELFHILSVKGDADIYFAPIGKFYTRLVFWDFQRAKESSSYLAMAREIIAVPNDWCMLPMVKNYFPYLELGGIVYFYSSVTQILPLHPSFVVRMGTTVIGRVDFVDRSNVPEFRPIVRQTSTNMMILNQHVVVNLCVCSLKCDDDVARLFVQFYPDGEVPLYLLNEVVLFSSSSYGGMGLAKWKDLKPPTIVKMSKRSVVKFLSVTKMEHCKRFNPTCSKCMDSVLKANSSPKPCSCSHSGLLMGPTQTYLARDDNLSDKISDVHPACPFLEASDAQERDYACFGAVDEWEDMRTRSMAVLSDLRPSSYTALTRGHPAYGDISVDAYGDDCHVPDS